MRTLIAYKLKGMYAREKKPSHARHFLQSVYCLGICFIRYLITLFTYRPINILSHLTSSYNILHHLTLWITKHTTLYILCQPCAHKRKSHPYIVSGSVPFSLPRAVFYLVLRSNSLFVFHSSCFNLQVWGSHSLLYWNYGCIGVSSPIKNIFERSSYNFSKISYKNQANL